MRRLIVLIYVLFFVDEVGLLSLVPLVPVYSDRFDLSKAESGALLAAFSLAIVFASVPAGMLSDRFGARGVTLAAGALIAVANLATGHADSYPTLLATRVFFGMGSAAVWTATLAWLADSAEPHRRASALSGVVAVAGLGGMLGPVMAGAVTDRLSVDAWFTCVGAAAAMVTLLLVGAPAGRSSQHDHQPFRTLVDVSRREVLIAAGLVVMTLGGLADGVINLLASLELSAGGLSAAATGLVFSMASAILIAVSSMVARAGNRAISIRSCGIAAMVQAGALIPVLVSLSVVPVIATVLLRAPFAAWPYAVGLPLAAAGAHRRGVRIGTVNGFLGIAWGGANFIGPPAAGLIAGAAGDRTAYACLFAFTLAVAFWLLRTAAREPVPVAVTP
ncbi:MAG TPA: MFS transporter [Gaiellales bacterium]|jgi:MFS family permease|nr:MFS transporter [Gaiellales bacterium]